MPDQEPPRELQEQQKDRQKYRADLLRILVLYPLLWIAVSLILFYLVKIK